MKCTPLAIPDVVLIEPSVFGDQRGFLIPTWIESEFRRAVADVPFVQDNHSRSRAGTLRGLHFQREFTQGKLVRCSRGRVWDVAVDLRAGSATHGQWVAAELSDESHQQLWIPPGFAHGFLVLSDVADLQYKVTDQYHPASEGTLLWNDPAVAIAWPIAPDVEPLLSDKDRRGSLLADIEPLR